MNVPVPPMTPYLCVSNAAKAIEFYKNAFGAVLEGEAHTMPGTNQILHQKLLINGAMIMLADDFSKMMNLPPQTPETLGGSPITLGLHFEDVQPAWDRAVAGGATVTMPIADQFWGDRYGQVVDPFGHKWSFSQTIKQMTDAEMSEAARAQFGGSASGKS